MREESAGIDFEDGLKVCKGMKLEIGREPAQSQRVPVSSETLFVAEFSICNADFAIPLFGNSFNAFL